VAVYGYKASTYTLVYLAGDIHYTNIYKGIPAKGIIKRG
jgi:hypothetical protein